MKKSVSLLIGLFLLISTPVVYGEETILWSDLVEHDGIYYKISTNTDSSPSLVLFSGKVTGEHQGNMRNGKREGPWIRYWDDGQLRWKLIYKDGRGNGLYSRYWENGQLSTKGSFKDGLRDGLWVRYYDNGQLKEKGSFRKGKRDGHWVVYWENGQLWFKGIYKDGEKVGGDWIEYAMDGSVL